MLDAIGRGAVLAPSGATEAAGEAAVAASGMAGALRSAHGQPAEAARAPDVLRLNAADARLQRQDVGRVLAALEARVSSLETPARPRWVEALRIGPLRRPETPPALALLRDLQRQLAAGSAPALDIRESARFSLQMEKLAGLLPSGGPRPEISRGLAELSERLALHGHAAWAQLARSEAETQLLPQFARFDRPGASSERHVGGSVGVGLGLGEGGVGAKASFNVGLGWGRSVDNDDEGFVFRNRSKTATASAAIGGGVGVAKLSVGVDGRAQHTRYEEYDSATAFVKLNADTLGRASRRDTLGQGARAAVGALIRLFRPGHGNELKHYHRLQQQAADQQQRLGVLLGWLGQRDASAPLPGSRPAVVPSGDIVSVKGGASARAEAAGLSAGVGVSVERIDIHAKAWTPYWRALASPRQAARDPEIAAQRLAGIEAQAQALFDGPRDRAGARPLSRLSAVASARALRECGPEVLLKAAQGLAAELDHFCAVAQQLDAGIGKRQGGARVERSIADSWRGRSREDVLANMALAHAALMVAAAERPEAAPAAQALADIAPRLYAPPIRHNAGALARRTAFLDTLELKIVERSHTLNLGGGIGPLGVKAEATLVERLRVHLNPVRAGDYKDLRLTLSGSLADAGALDKLKGALMAQLAPHGLAEALPAALADAQSALSGQLGGGVTLLLRFYRPQYHSEADFPARAAGFRLQLSRVSASGEAALSVSGGVPLQPGVSLELGLNAGASAGVVLRERWGDNSLSAPMMHYLHLQAVGEAERWPDLRLDQRPALQGLFRRLAEPGSAVRAEAEYFLRRQPQDGFGERFAEAMRGHGDGEAGFTRAEAALEELMQRQYPLWQADKLAFPGWSESPAAA
ncbi:hypothetical protein ACPRNU_09245 [Chromobacterium vaccinii]|uniref:hypothetical protein n=1 Tax=Chromobacterium vaccinii TaxID=1108595 RepID=UPI003C7774F5